MVTESAQKNSWQKLSSQEVDNTPHSMPSAEYKEGFHLMNIKRLKRPSRTTCHDFSVRYKKARIAQKEADRALEIAEIRLEEANKAFKKARRLKKCADDEVEFAEGQVPTIVEEFHPTFRTNISTPRRSPKNMSPSTPPLYEISPTKAIDPENKHGELPYAVFVVGAGSQEVNGLYTKEGVWSTDVLLYSKTCQIKKTEKDNKRDYMNLEETKKMVLCKMGDGKWALCETAVSVTEIKQINPASAKYYYSSDIEKRDSKYNSTPPDSKEWSGRDGDGPVQKIGQHPAPSFDCWYFHSS